MNKLIIGFVFVIMVSRFFSETLGVAPKAVDLLDIAVIPLLLVLAAGSRPPRGVDTALHRRLLNPTVAFFFLCILSAVINYERVFLGPVVLFIFGMLEGPILFLSLNKLINDKRRFGMEVARFIEVMLLIEIVVVVFVSYPTLIFTGNPDKMSGTFGNNSYQFTVLLIIIGGYLLGKQLAAPRKTYYAIAVQVFIVVTFMLLQYRTATPAFFLSYAIISIFMFGRRFVRFGLLALPLLFVAGIGYKYVNRSANMDLKYRDLISLKDDVDEVLGHGKALAYVNTMTMYSETPTAILFGCGPGTFVSRACYTFTNELKSSQNKGVGPIVTAVFGDKDYASDVYMRYIDPLSQLEAMYGSVQINNPNSSILAVLAETGIPGLIFMLVIYGVLARRSFRYLRFAMRTRDPLILPLASALAIGVTYLCLISPLDNYLEVARVTIPIWLLFWTVGTLVHQQRTEFLMRRHQQAALQYQQMQESPETDPDDPRGRRRIRR